MTIGSDTIHLAARSQIAGEDIRVKVLEFANHKISVAPSPYVTGTPLTTDDLAKMLIAAQEPATTPAEKDNTDN